MIHERDRMAQRADKWWRSVWHVQMCMHPRGWDDVRPDSAKPLTTKVSPRRVKPQSQPTDMSDGPTDGARQ